MAGRPPNEVQKTAGVQSIISDVYAFLHTCTCFMTVQTAVINKIFNPFYLAE